MRRRSPRQPPLRPECASRPPEPEPPPEYRRAPRAGLGVCCFKVNGCSRALGDHRLRADNERISHRNPSAMKRIRLDSVDRSPPAPDDRFGSEAQQKPRQRKSK